MLTEFVERLLGLIYPEKCIFCGKTLDSGRKYCCAECQDRTNADQTVKYAAENQFFRMAVAPFCYEGAVKAALHRYKFGSEPHYAEAFAHFMLPVIIKNGFCTADHVTFVPGIGGISRSRGYNQTELIARALHRQSHAKIKKPVKLIKKIKKIPHQYQVSGNERANNVAGAFAPAVRIDLTGCRVLLIDDILTTGATASECARCLIKMGAESVDVAVAAMPKFARSARG